MSTRTQRLANRFPLWTAVRKDPSSLGQRLLSTFAEYYQFNSTSQLRMQDELHLLKWQLGRGSINFLDLDTADYMTVSSGPGGVRIETPPTSVVGTIVATNYPMTQVLSFEELLGSVPTRLEAVTTHTGVTGFSVWSSATPTVFTAIDIPNRLTLRVQNSTEYKKRTRFKNRQFSGFHGVILTGLDQNHVEFQEEIEFPDDGLFTTRNIFKSLTAVDYEGFDGALTIHSSSSGQELINDIYQVAVSPELEGPMELRVTPYTTAGATVTTKLEFTTQVVKDGQEYRTGSNDILDNTEIVCHQLLLDSGSAHYIPVDSALNHRNTKLYVLDNAGNIHIYEHGLPLFSPPGLTIAKAEEALSAAVEVQPLQPYVLLDETERVWTWLARPQQAVTGVEIRRRDPAGTVEYLQANLTWAAGTYRFSQKPDALTAEESWQDFQFTTVYDQLGQWEYYTTTYTAAGAATVYTAVMVGSQSAAVSLATGVVNPTTLHIGANENLYVGDGADVYEISEHGDYYFADFGRQRIYTLETYDSVTVTI